MLMKKETFKGVKTCILGIQGSGKTYFTQNKFLKQFRRPIVYGVHIYEWEKAPAKVSVYDPNRDTSVEKFDRFCKDIIDLARSGRLEYDCLVIDEADMFFRSNFDIMPNANDLFINHRHYGIALVFITRRPQDISTKIFEQSEHLFIFAIEGINVKKYIKNLHEDMEKHMAKLHKDKHNFIYKRIGEEPLLCDE